MEQNSTEFYSYLFQEEDGVIAVYFKTKTDTAYRVFFYPFYDTFDSVDTKSVLSNVGFFFGFTKLEPDEDKKEPFDFRVRNTVLLIINDFFEEKGIDKVLVFNYDAEDGKKLKRFSCFDYWYTSSKMKTYFKKFDEEIITTDDTGMKIDVDYLSLIIESDNPQGERLLAEFQSLKEDFIKHK
jgi:hypothetical protein